MTEHWLLYDKTGRTAPLIVWDADVAERAHELGRRIEGPFVPADQLTGAVCLTDDEWDRIVWWLSQPVPPSPMKALDVAILRKIATARGGQ